MPAAVAQQSGPLALEPSAANQGTTLLVTADASTLAPGGASARSLAIALPRGTRVDTAAREELCTRREAARGACPETARIGSGRYNAVVAGYALGGGETELGWALDAYAGEPQRRGDAASVVVIARLLGADLVASLLEPALSRPVPRATTTVGTVSRTTGSYGIEIRFPGLPVELSVAAPATAVPARLELSLGAVRRIRQNFVRRIRVRTPTGVQVREIADHRLVGRHLFRAPARCSGSWAAQLRVDLADGGVQRRTQRIACTKTLVR